MQINLKMLENCQILSDYEKDLIRRVDLNKETQAQTAKSYNKSASTICIQHKRAWKKFAAWRQNQKSDDATFSEERFEKEVFHMFNLGHLPNKVIAKVGHSDKVIRLWNIFRKLMEDDYSRALHKTAEYSIHASRNSKYPLTERLDLLLEEVLQLREEERLVRGILSTYGHNSHKDSLHEMVERVFLALKYKLRRSEENSEVLKQENVLKSKTIEVLTAENSNLAKFRIFEGLTDEEINERTGTLQILDTAIIERRAQLSDLDLQIYAIKNLLCNLDTKKRETLQHYLASMSVDEFYDLVIKPKWKRMWVTISSRGSYVAQA